ncbi:MAG: hypothetical protein HDQ96_07765 [Lachnospiraceae bacterium]|nr:hypothetical protein [Lachnospiraceae bacterium]
MNKRDWHIKSWYSRSIYKRLWILLMLLLLILTLAGCSTAAEDRSDTADEDVDVADESGDAADSATEKKQTLQEELDALVLQLASEDTEKTLPDLSQDAAAANFPAELVQQLHEALVAGTSDALLQELDDADLRIDRKDFDYVPRVGEELSHEEKDINDFLENQTQTESYDFYQLDVDGDGLDEIIMIERTRYEYSPSNTAILLEQDDAGSYTLASYNYIGYYRLYAIFSYEGTCYMVCNYDDYKRETTKALGLFELSGEVRGFTRQIYQEHIFLRRCSTDCEIRTLWTLEQTDELTEKANLQSSMETYIQEIGLDLMLRNQNSERFRGAEKELSEEEMDELTAALKDARWTPEHLDYIPQEQQWLFMLENQQVYFVLYYEEQPEQYLLEAFLYNGNGEKAKLEPIALYGIKPHIYAVIDDYWNYEDSNVENICYQPEDASQAFPENRSEVAAKLWQQVQGKFKPAALPENVTPENPASEEAETLSAGTIVPEGLVLLAEKALFTRDWSALDTLAAPLELTDHEAVYETWFAPMESSQTDPNYQTGLDIFRKYMCHIYQYSIGESRFFLLVQDSGGTARYVNISCYRLVENEREYLGYVGSLDMNARVVPYENGFYLVDTCYNYYSKYNDTIYLYPLTIEGISEQALKVTLLPEDYIWAKGYQSNASTLEQINNYVESIQKELMEASPISDDIIVYTGCEELVTDPVKFQRLSVDYYWDWYMVDYDNDGVPEYQIRHHWFPSNSTTLYLITEECRLENTTLKLLENWEPECPYSNYEYTLIQRWYQEFDNQIYTFQLFLTEGYNYYMNVSLWEEDHISWIASYYITPQCELKVQITGQQTWGEG